MCAAAAAAAAAAALTSSPSLPGKVPRGSTSARCAAVMAARMGPAGTPAAASTAARSHSTVCRSGGMTMGAGSARAPSAAGEEVEASVFFSGDARNALIGEEVSGGMRKTSTPRFRIARLTSPLLGSSARERA